MGGRCSVSGEAGVLKSESQICTAALVPCYPGGRQSFGGTPAFLLPF
ncbi:hypothetical protein E2C01_102191 [Portunus trituberculatus]|uniref:Uncharacterized protein n=1 Tax=Portunus trituberculatus TaxID=210409 RepID=A0A5B7K7H8_PORTR|nr:hypothetical protein [Portunus trituberculatus]